MIQMERDNSCGRQIVSQTASKLNELLNEKVRNKHGLFIVRFTTRRKQLNVCLILFRSVV